MKMRILCAAAAGVCLLLTGCTSPLRQGVDYYHQVAPDVQIGMSKNEALAILQPAAEMMPADEQRPPERFVDDQGRLNEIYFFRSRIFYDYMLTDDEFTPYVFRDGTLTAIGWEALGGPKTQAMPAYPRTRFQMGFGYGYRRW